MINLMPPERKEAYRYARRNHHMARWLNYAGLGLLGALLLSAGGVLYMNRSINDYTSNIAFANKQLQQQDLPKIQTQVTSISNNLKLVVQVLSREVLFSELLKQLGKVTPQNVILTNLSISQTQGAIDITAQTTDYAAATQLQVNLADAKNQIFSKADIVSINCQTEVAKQYPCTATLRALFASNNPFLFINTPGTKVTP